MNKKILTIIFLLVIINLYSNDALDIGLYDDEIYELFTYILDDDLLIVSDDFLDILSTRNYSIIVIKSDGALEVRNLHNKLYLYEKNNLATHNDYLTVNRIINTEYFRDLFIVIHNSRTNVDEIKRKSLLAQNERLSEKEKKHLNFTIGEEYFFLSQRERDYIRETFPEDSLKIINFSFDSFLETKVFLQIKNANKEVLPNVTMDISELFPIIEKQSNSPQTPYGIYLDRNKSLFVIPQNNQNKELTTPNLFLIEDGILKGEISDLKSQYNNFMN